jgi:hypothetical protein
MKLSIATGILAAKTLPDISEESSAEAIDYARSPLENERFIPTTNKKNHQQQQYRSGTKKARRGGSLFHQGRRHGNKLLVNKALPLNNGKTLCDP